MHKILVKIFNCIERKLTVQFYSELHINLKVINKLSIIIYDALNGRIFISL